MFSGELGTRHLPERLSFLRCFLGHGGKDWPPPAHLFLKNKLRQRMRLWTLQRHSTSVTLIANTLSKVDGAALELSQGGAEQHACFFAGRMPTAAGGDASKPGCMQITGLSSRAVIGTETAETPREGNHFAGGRNQEWASSVAVAHLSWSQGRGISSHGHKEGGFLPASPLARRYTGVDHSIACCPFA